MLEENWDATIEKGGQLLFQSRVIMLNVMLVLLQNLLCYVIAFL